MRNRFGKPAVVNPRYVCGPSAHLSFNASVVTARDVDGRYRTRHGVEAGGEDDRVEGEGFVGGVDAGFCDLSDRMFSDVDKAHMRQVVGGVIVRVQAWPFRPMG